MARPIRDLSNQRFGKLTVISQNPHRKERHVQWDCLCDCGNKLTVVGYSLTRGLTLSCGCYAAKTWTFLDPQENTHTCTNLAEFCRVQELNIGCMRELASGLIHQYKGWVFVSKREPKKPKEET